MNELFLREAHCIFWLLWLLFYTLRLSEKFTVTIEFLKNLTMLYISKMLCNVPVGLGAMLDDGIKRLPEVDRRHLVASLAPPT